jgi:hypothetical protein
VLAVVVVDTVNDEPYTALAGAPTIETIGVPLAAMVVWVADAPMKFVSAGQTACSEQVPVIAVMVTVPPPGAGVNVHGPEAVMAAGVLALVVAETLKVEK